MKYKLTICEYGQPVREYSDNDKVRFLERSKDLINEHLTKFSNQIQDIKNIQIHIATYE